MSRAIEIAYMHRQDVATNMELKKRKKMKPEPEVNSVLQ